ncbi:MAG: hypothetical protein MHM6MM_003884 [Cercozoa sp. M6MM]
MWDRVKQSARSPSTLVGASVLLATSIATWKLVKLERRRRFRRRAESRRGASVPAWEGDMHVVVGAGASYAKAAAKTPKTLETLLAVLRDLEAAANTLDKVVIHVSFSNDVVGLVRVFPSFVESLLPPTLLSDAARLRRFLSHLLFDKLPVSTEMTVSRSRDPIVLLPQSADTPFLAKAFDKALKELGVAEQAKCDRRTNGNIVSTELDRLLRTKVVKTATPGDFVHLYTPAQCDVFAFIDDERAKEVLESALLKLRADLSYRAGGLSTEGVPVAVTPAAVLGVTVTPTAATDRAVTATGAETGTCGKCDTCSNKAASCASTQLPSW